MERSIGFDNIAHNKVSRKVVKLTLQLFRLGTGTHIYSARNLKRTAAALGLQVGIVLVTVSRFRFDGPEWSPAVADNARAAKSTLLCT
jgi:hypothetical protein